MTISPRCWNIYASKATMMPVSRRNPVWESVSAFANTKGGVLLLGISEDGDFSPVPGFDANHIASQFMDGMGDGNPQGARLTNPPE